jgi:hypothetical protein
MSELDPAAPAGAGQTPDEDTIGDFPELQEWADSLGFVTPKNPWHAYLHRYIDKDTKPQFLKSYTSEFPRLDDIARIWGTGTYQLTVEAKKANAREGNIHKRKGPYLFDVDGTYWETLREEAALDDEPTSAAAPAADTLAVALGIVERIHAMTVDLYRQTIGGNAAAQASPIKQFREILGMAQEVNDLMDGGGERMPDAPDGTAVYKMAPGPRSIPAPGPMVPAWLKEIITQLEPFVPAITAALKLPPAISKMAIDPMIAFIKKQSDFQKVSGDPAATQVFINWAVSQFGREEAKRLFKDAFGIDLVEKPA